MCSAPRFKSSRLCLFVSTLTLGLPLTFKGLARCHEPFGLYSRCHALRNFTRGAATFASAFTPAPETHPPRQGEFPSALILKDVKRVGLYGLVVLVLALTGYAAYSLGRGFRPQPSWGGTVLENPVDITAVELLTSEGEAVTLERYRGDWLLVFFGFTHCPDVCPLTLARTAKIYQDLGEPDAIKLAMITVDPANDTPELTDQYAKGFHPAFVGYGGSPQQIAEAAKTFYVGYQGSGTQVAHTDALFLVNPEGQMQVVYSQAKLDSLEPDLRRLLAKL